MIKLRRIKRIWILWGKAQAQRSNQELRLQSRSKNLSLRRLRSLHGRWKKIAKDSSQKKMRPQSEMLHLISMREHSMARFLKQRWLLNVGWKTSTSWVLAAKKLAVLCKSSMTHSKLKVFLQSPNSRSIESERCWVEVHLERLILRCTNLWGSWWL